jgi:hypothetical protein
MDPVEPSSVIDFNKGIIAPRGSSHFAWVLHLGGPWHELQLV